MSSVRHKILASATAAFLTASLLTAAAQTAQPNVVLHRTVTYADYQTYIELPFDVPAGVTRVTVEASYTGRDKRTTIDLGLFDGERFRGWSGGNKSTFTVSETDATPSYLPGPIRPGRWKLILGVPNIREGVRSAFTANIFFAHAADVPAVSTFSDKPLKTTPAWYRGDLHMHDAHSDGSCLSQSGKKVPCPLYRTVETAAHRGLDFIAVSDHNTISQYNDLRELQPYFDQLLLIPARENTTFEGHANAYGTTQFIDFRLTSPHVPTLNRLLTQVEQLGGLFSINHPGDPSGEMCMGCGWTVPDTDFSRIHSIEVVNGDDASSAIPIWQEQLNKGFRITGVGGSDNHDADLPPDARSAIGHPTTVIYAPELSEHAILNAIRAGHVFVDTQGTRDRVLEFTANTAGTTAIMGDNIHAPAGQPIHFIVKMTALQNDHAEIIEDGAATTLLDATPSTTPDETRTFDVPCDGKRHWFRVNIRSATDKLLIVGNPIYVNF
jgi:hypothetical protein